MNSQRSQTLLLTPSGGGRLVIESRQSGRRSTQVMEFGRHGHVRMTHEDDDTFGILLTPDGTPFFFGSLSGSAVAVDLLAGLAKAGANSLHTTAPGIVTREQVSGLAPMGMPQSVAALDGESFRVEWRDVDGSCRFEEIVLTRDPRLTSCMRTLAAALRHDTGIRSHDTRLDCMVERGWFALSAEGYRVTSARFESPPSPQRFELEAVPCDDLRVMFQVVIEAARSRVLNRASTPVVGQLACRTR